MAIENSFTVNFVLLSVKTVILLLTFSTAVLSVFADCMVRIKLLEYDPSFFTALAMCSPDESSIVDPVVSCVESYAAPSVEQGDDVDPHDLAVDPVVGFTYILAP